MHPYTGIPMMRKTLSQLTCLYQFWRVMTVSAIWTFLVSAGRGRAASAGLADMVNGLFPPITSLSAFEDREAIERRTVSKEGED